MPLIKTRIRTLLAALIVLLLVGICTPAQASLDFLLSPSSLTAAPGSSVTFTALLRNTGPDALYLNADFGLVDAPLVVDDSLFISRFLLPTPQPTLPADNLWQSVPLFAVIVPDDPTLLGQSFLGSFTLYGGATPDDQDELATQDFGVRVAPTAASAVPEPGSLLLCALVGLPVLIAAGRRHR